MVVWMIGKSVAEKDCTRLRQFPAGYLYVLGCVLVVGRVTPSK